MEDKSAAQLAISEKEKVFSETDPVKGSFVYQKKKDVKIYITPEKNLLVEVSLEDKNHELSLATTFSPHKLNIMDIKCEMKRCPHNECRLALPSLDVIIGERVRPGIAEILKKAVGSNGCTHLNNLFQEACYSVIQGQGVLGRSELEKLFEGITDDQVKKIFLMLKPDLVDSCVCLKQGNGFIENLEKTDLPPGAELLKPVQ